MFIIDDDLDEVISAYLNEDYRNDMYNVEYEEVQFEAEKGYESLLSSSKVTSANVILIESELFENGSIKGEAFPGQ